MFPETAHLWGLDFTLYGGMRVVAIAAATALFVLFNRRQGIRVRTSVLIALVCAPVGIVSARLLNCLEFDPAATNLVAAYSGNPGSSVYGALIGSLLAAGLLARVLAIPTLQFLDAAAAPLALGEALSRVGCFLAGCCYGVPFSGPWAVSFPGDSFATIDQRSRGLIDSTASESLWVHPVQLYSAVLMLLLTWVLVRSFNRAHRRGSVFFALLLGYGLYRLAIAPLRMEALSSMKVFSAAFILVGIAGLAWLKARPTGPASAHESGRELQRRQQRLEAGIPPQRIQKCVHLHALDARIQHL